METIVPPNQDWQPMEWSPPQFAEAEATKTCPECGKPMTVFVKNERYQVSDFGPPLMVMFTTIVCETGHFQHRSE